ncbi:MAG: Methyltransferase type 11 [Chitinophagaceae bacterium]|nr:Methyltransferase type 11 [Chitinophagaceae bacterium]
MSESFKITDQLAGVYDKQYSEESRQWRELGAKGKAENILEIAKGMSFKNVLDVGSGDGSVLAYLDSKKFNSNMYSVDISSSGVEEIKKRNIPSLKEVTCYDGFHIPYPDNHFDLTICSHVIEHVEFPRLLLREIKRVSKYQILEVPIDFSLNVDKKVEHFLAYGHINIYSPQTFRFLIKTEGFEIIKDLKAVYTNELLNFLYRKKWIKRIKQKTLFAIWKCIPFLMNVKPSTITVLSKKTDKGLEIF